MIADRYEIVQTLGQGAFGRTFLARDTQGGGRLVAIKMLDPRGADLKAFELFDREAAVLRSLRHHGIPEIHETIRARFEGHDASFLVMEYIDGLSLARMIGEGRHLESTEATALLLEILGILDYLHGRVPPILHRDIKPANIIVRPDGSPVVVDFGSVRRVFISPEESGSTIAGTYGYMPYEQYMGQASPSSDLYAVGATMLHMLTGRAPREFMNGEGRIEVPAELPGGARLREVVARMLRSSPSERFASARDARQALLASDAMVLARGGTAITAQRARGMQRRMITVELPDEAPRPLTGETKTHYLRCAHSMWDIMNESDKAAPDFSVSGFASVMFFSVVTAGILPMVFWNLAHDRRRRLKRFFKEGTLATAEILNIEATKLPFEVQGSKVSYEFEADGQILRDADSVLPSISNRWRVGDRIQVLYIADLDYDSVIVSTS
jgi:serine/threonine protein kinase